MSQPKGLEMSFPVEYLVPVKGARSKMDMLILIYAALQDALSIQLGTLLGVIVYQQLRFEQFRWPTTSTLWFASEYTIIFCFFAYKRDVYKHAHSLLEIRATAEILRVSTLGLALVTMTIFFHHLIVPRLMLMLGWVITTVILVAQHHFTRETIIRWKSKNVTKRNVVILGAGQEARRIFSILTKSPDLGLRPVAFVAESAPGSDPVIFGHDYRPRDSAPVLHERMTSELIERLDVQEVYVADPSMSDDRIGELVSLGLERSISISFISSKRFSGHTGPVEVRFLDGLHVSSAATEEEQDFIYAFAKRFTDILVSALLILFTAPLWVFIATWVKLSSPGPVFFRQNRIAKGGRVFKMLKFRSMYVTAPKYGVSPTSSLDPRVTPIGRFLRKASLDELPQLLNVLLGDMSLVGPRPEMPFLVERYSGLEKQRLLVDQGMTGFWQLSADRKGPIHERIEYDLYYLEQRGFFFDVAILAHTAFFAMKGI